MQIHFALQQLTMERYNDAISKVMSGGMLGDELFNRGTLRVSDPSRAATEVLPIVEEKVAILEQMNSEEIAYRAALLDGPKDVVQAHEVFLKVILERARLQLACWQDWIENPAIDMHPRIDSLNEAEQNSMTVVINVVNNLIERAGLQGDPWLSINWQAFNTVRGRVGLPPLTESDFRDRFFRVISGGQTRFFD